jgi:hypothetical protein
MDLTTLTYGEVPDGVRWSSPADIGGVPETWDETDQYNVAGFTQLGGDGGSIIDGLALRDAFIIYRERGISVMDYVPGSPYVFRIRHQSTTYGLACKDAVIEVEGVHLFIADGDIMMNDGNKTQSIINNRIRKDFISDFSAGDFHRSFVIKNSVADEAWFCIPKHGDTHPTKAYIYNWKDNTWGIRDIPAEPYATYGYRATENLAWNTVVPSWADIGLVWNRREISASDDTVIAVVKPQSKDNISTAGKLRYLDVDTATESQYVTIIEREGFALDGVSKLTTITSVYPHARGGSFWVQLGSMDWPGSPIRWKEAVLFDPATMRKVDIRTTGELHCYKFWDNLTDQGWEISGMEVEFTSAGLR